MKSFYSDEFSKEGGDIMLSKLIISSLFLIGLVTQMVSLNAVEVNQINFYNDIVKTKLMLLDKGEAIIEYGEKVDFKNYFIESDAEIENVDFNTKEIGEQTAYIKLAKNKVNYKLSRNFIVKDTQAPKIKIKEKNISIIKGKKYDPVKNIESCKDPIDGKITPTIKTSLDINKIGKYKVLVVAEDKNGNSTEKEFTVTVKKPIEVPKKVVSSNTKLHTINTYNVFSSYSFSQKYTQYIYDKVQSGEKDFLVPNATNWDEVINSKNEYCREVLDYHFYLSSYKVGENEFGVHYKIDYDEVQNYKARSQQKIHSYRNFIANALSTMNLNCTDAEMVQQINNYIVKNFSYKSYEETSTTYGVKTFVETKKGKCWHYAMLFRDMCKAVGIPVGYVEGYAYGDFHAWNYVYIDGTKYWFDTTLNDSHHSNQFSFMSNSQLSKTHSW